MALKLGTRELADAIVNEANTIDKFIRSERNSIVSGDVDVEFIVRLADRCRIINNRLEYVQRTAPNLIGLRDYIVNDRGITVAEANALSPNITGAAQALVTGCKTVYEAAPGSDYVIDDTVTADRLNVFTKKQFNTTATASLVPLIDNLLTAIAPLVE